MKNKLLFLDLFRNKLQLFLLFFLLLIGSQTTFAQYDTEFWVPASPRYSDSAMRFILSTNEPVANVSFYSGNSSVPFQTQTITNASPTTVAMINNPLTSVPYGYLPQANFNTASASAGIRITSDVAITSVGFYDRSNNQDLFQCLGRVALGQTFRAASQSGADINFTVSGGGTHFASVIATEDNTTVTIDNLGRNLLGGGTTSTFVLNKGETRYVFTDDADTFITGALVTSDKPVSLISGSHHMNSGHAASDAAVENITPISEIATQYVVAKGQASFTDIDYALVVAHTNGTTVTIDGTLVTTINAGQFYKYNINVAQPFGTPHYIETNNPAYVFHSTAAGNTDEIGFSQLPGLVCRGNKSISFVKINPSGATNQLYVQIPTVGVPSFRLNGVAYSGTILAVPTRPDYSVLTYGSSNPEFQNNNFATADEFFNIGILSASAGATGLYGFLTGYDFALDVIDPVAGIASVQYEAGALCSGDSTTGTLIADGCYPPFKIISTTPRGGASSGTATFTANSLDYSFVTAPTFPTAGDLIDIVVEDNLGNTTTVAVEIPNSGGGVCGPITDNEVVSTLSTSTIISTPIQNLLLGDTDPDTAPSSPLVVQDYTIFGIVGTQAVGVPVTIPTVGEITINANGSYIFDPLPTFTGAVPLITYDAFDGAYSTPGTLTINVSADNDTDGIDAARDLDDDNDGVTDIAELNCPSGFVSLSNSFARTDNPGFVTNIYPYGGVDATFSYSLIGSATWNSGVSSQGPTAGITGNYINVQPNNTDFSGNDLAVYTLTFSQPVYNLNFKFGGLDNFDRADFTATNPSGLDIPVSLTDINLGSGGVFTGQSVVSSNSGSNSPNNSVQISVTNGPIQSLTIRTAKNNGSSSSVTLQLYELSYCLTKDTDGDLVDDYLDLDSDNDGCSDANEYYGLASADGGDGGVYGTGTPTVGADGRVTTASYIGNATNNVIATQTTVDTNPVNQNISTGTNAVFTASASAVNTTTFAAGLPNYTLPPATDGSATLAYRWQESTDAGATWSNLSNNALYSGTTTTTLTLTNPTVGLNNYQYKVVVSNSSNACTALSSSAAVLSFNNPPVAIDDISSTTLTEDGVDGTINILSNDIDVDGNPTVVSLHTIDLDLFSAGDNNTITDAQGEWTYDTLTGEITFNPADNFNGLANLDYRICDSTLLCDNARVSFNVAAANDAPVANDDTVALALTEDGANGTVNILTNDTDVDGNPTPVSGHTVDLDTTLAGVQTSFTNPLIGTWTYDTVTGIVTFDPVTNYNSVSGLPAVLEYELCDASASCDVANITFTVTSVNDAPVAQNDSTTTTEENAVTINVVSDLPGVDTDSDGTVGVATVDLDPSLVGIQNTFTVALEGTYTVDVLGVVTFTPVANFNGSTTPIDYTVNDNLGLVSNVATLSITVTAVNDAPLANNDTVALALTEDGANGTVNILTNDTDVDGNPTPVSGHTVDLDPTTVGVFETVFSNVTGTWTYDTVTGVVTFDPATNFNGPAATLTYELCDASASCDTADITFSVIPVNDVPVLDNDVNTTDEDTDTVGGDLTDAGDSDPDGTALTVNTTPVDGPDNGTIVLNADGTYVYTPNPEFNGTDVITVEICDAGIPGIACSTQILTITVNPINDAPVANDDTVALALTEDGANGTVNILTNDTDIEGNPTPVSGHTVDLDTANAGVQSSITTVDGTWTYDTVTGVVTFDPATNYNGTAVLEYELCDASASCDTADITFTVTSVNDAPVAQNDVTATAEEFPVTINVITNVGGIDSDSDGTINDDTVDLNPSLAGIQTTYIVPTEGVYIVDLSGNITFTPAVNFIGATTPLNYTVNDNDGLVSNVATLIINVSPVNDNPVANDDTVALALTEDGANGTVNILTNDTDADGNPTPVSGHTIDLDTTTPFIQTSITTTDGTWTYDTVTGVVTFDPAENVFGTAVLEYQLCDSGDPGLCDEANITFTVISVNDAPVAQNDSTTTAEDTAVTINVVSDLPGVDSDSDGTIDVSTVDLDPTLVGIQNTFTVPTEGTYTVDALGEVTFNPVANFNGTTTPINYTVNDNDGLVSNIATLLIEVTPVNDVPVANDDTVTLALTEDGVNGVVNILTNDTDNDGNPTPFSGHTVDLDPSTPLTIETTFTDSLVGTWTYDTVTGEVTFDPANAFNGPASLVYNLCDSDGDCDDAIISFTVNAVNDLPVANNDLSSTDEDVAVVIPVLINDLDSDGSLVPSTVVITTIPNNGTTSIDPLTGEITYTPNLGFNGIDTFTYQVCDDGTPLPAQCDAAVVTVVVGAVNDIPVIVNDTNVTNEDTPVTGDVSNSADFDPDGTTLVVNTTPISGPSNGTIVLQPDGTYVYTPNLNFNGTDVISIEICDLGTPTPVSCVTQLLTITVNPINDTPIVDNDVATTNEDTPTVGGDLTDFGDNDDAEGVDEQDLVVTTTPIDGPDNGTIVINSDGSYVYTPNPDFNGTDVVTIEVCDQGSPLPAICVNQTLTITVVPVNDVPVANDDTVALALIEDEENGTVNILVNDTDVDGNPTVTSGHTIDLDPSNPGVQDTVVITNEGSWTYDTTTGVVTFDPELNFNGVASIPYELCDSDGDCDLADITFTVTAVNDAPIVDNDVATTNEDTPTVGGDLTDLGDNDDADGTLLVVTTTPIDGPDNGTIVINSDGTYVYTPNPDFNGTDVVTIEVCDQGSPLPAICVNQTLTITVVPVNDVPVANDDTVALALIEDEENGTVNILVNDTDIDGNPTVTSGHTIDLDPSNPGVQDTVIITNEGSWTYDTTTGVVTFDPELNFNGVASIPYELCDSDGDCDSADITFTVTAVNDAPIANDDNDVTSEDIPVVIDVTNNDSDLESAIDPTTVVVTVPPTNGTTSVDPTTGEVTYTPNSGFSGIDEFTYQVCDSGLPLPAVCDSAVVYLTITAVNDAPVIVDDTNETNEDTPVTGDVTTTNDFDSDGTPLVVNTIPVNGPANGTIVIQPDGTYVYTPNPNFNGTDVITIEVCDSGTPLPAICDNQTLTITVNPINDAPVANNDLVSTPEDTLVVIPVTNNDTDLDGNLVSSSVAITVVSNNGTTTINPTTGEISYTPNLGFNGIDKFSYQVCDDGTPLPALCDIAEVTVLVAPINDVPVILPDTNVTNEDTPVSGDITNSADFDPDGTTLVVTTTPVDGPDNGTIVIQPDGTYVYTPNPNFNGVDTVLITVCDSGTPLAANCVDQLLTITVNPVNDAPIAINDVASTPEDIAVLIPVISNDSDLEGPIDPASVTITSPPSNGTTSINTTTGVVTYTPNPGYNGMDEFTYQVCDSGTPLPAQCVTAVVSLTVTAVNDVPVIVDDINVTNEDTPVSGDVTNAADFDSDGTTLVANSTPVSGPSNGTIIIQPDGTYIYTPNPNFNGIDVVTIEVCDSGNPLPAICENQTLTITVNPVNDAPVVDNDVATTNEDTPTVGGDLTDSGDSDPDGTPLLVTTTPVDGPDNGTIVINPDGTYEYTPDSNFNGTDVITVQVCDSGTPLPASCVNQTLTITVVPVNDAPVANDDTVALALSEDGANGTVNIFTNDTDIDGTPTPTSGHTVDLDPSIAGNQSILTDAQGTWTFDTTTGVLTFDPALNYNGPASIPYTLCDAGTPILCDGANISFTVTSVNDAPVVDNDVNTINEDTLATGDLTDSGDSDLDGTPLVVTTTPVDGPDNGTIVINPDGTYEYTPDPNFNGTDVITVQVCDSGTPLPASCVNQTLTITVVPVNDAPVANDDTVALPLIEDGSNGTVNIFTNDTDIDGNPTPVSGHTVDLNPTVSGNQSILTDAQGTWTFDTTTGALTFDPALNFNEPASIPYTLCDAGLPILCDGAIITFTVTSVNDAPVANNDITSTPEDTPVTINVVTNSIGPDTDVDGTINVASVDLNPSLLGVQTTFTVPLEGVYSADASGNVTFTPIANFIGETTPINYTVSDNLGLVSNVATLTITVVKSNDPPVANEDVVTLPLVEDGANGSVNIFTNDTDIDGNPTPISGHTVDLNPTIIGNQSSLVDSQGTWAFDTATGVLTFDPALNFNGTATIPYTLCDAGTPILCDDAFITFTVTPVNDAPVANSDSGITLSETPITIAIINNPVLTGQDTDVEGNATIALNSIDLNPSIPGLQQILVVAGEGTYTANPNGTLTFVPVPSAIGFTSIIVYTILDNAGAVSNVASVTIEVGACIDNPILDCDEDGLTNAQEAVVGTDLTNPDTDGDGVIDGTEVVDGTAPLNPCESIEENVTVEQSIAFKAGDCDDDGLPNGNEIGPDPTNPLDSNGNGTLDYLEPNNHNQSNSEDGIEIFSGVSPDGGDVLNAVFTIRNIELFPNNTVEIYNRWGVLVYETFGYGQNGKYFRGESDGRVTVSKSEQLPEATYFYILKYTKPSGETKERSGYLYINR